MHKSHIATGALLAGLAVILGAFAAHKLREIAPESVSSFQTGAQYQMYHAFAIIICGILMERFNGKLMRAAVVCFGLGIILFSGSLYLLTYLKTTGTVGLSGIGIITPFGGLFFIAGWICMAMGVLRSRGK